MIVKAKMVILALALLAPTAALGGQEFDYGESQQRYLKAAEAYRLKAVELGNQSDALRASQQAIVKELVQVYQDLADTKVALADAVGARDWVREESLERAYYQLIDREQRLWSDLEHTK